jgi:hypothetical protein
MPMVTPWPTVQPWTMAPWADRHVVADEAGLAGVDV